MRKWLANLLDQKRVNLPEFDLPRRPQWHQGDQDQLASFLKSKTGQKLLTMLRGAQIQNALLGAKDKVTTQHSAGRTEGMGEAIDLITSLSRFADPLPQKQPEREKTDEEKLLESWAP